MLCFRNLMYTILTRIWGGADKSLAQPTSRCSRTESIVSLERGVCSCAKLQVFSCYRGWKEACQAMCAISTSRHELRSSFFPARQGAEGKSRHSDRHIRVTCTIVCHHQKQGGPIETWWFLHLWCALSWTTQKSDQLEIIDQIHELILEDHRILAKSIAAQLGISREWIGSIIHEDFDMQKLSAKWSRNAWRRIKNINSASRLSNFWNFFSTIQMISCRDWWPWTKPGYITMTRRQSNNQWSGGIVAHPAPPQKIPSAEICWKNSRLDFLDQDGILLIDYLPKGRTMNTDYYLSLLVQLKDILKEKRSRKVTKGVLFLHNNALAQWALVTQKKLAYLGFQCLDHPAYSPDLAPSDYHLFPGLK